MSHFGRSGPPDISHTCSLLVFNITFLIPLFDKYGKVVDVFIPKDRRTGDSRGLHLCATSMPMRLRKRWIGSMISFFNSFTLFLPLCWRFWRVVDGREITVQFAKNGLNAERIDKGRIIESFPRSRSCSPRRMVRDDYIKDRDYGRSCSRSYDRYERDRYSRKDRDPRLRSRSRCASPGYIVMIDIAKPIWIDCISLWLYLWISDILLRLIFSGSGMTISKIGIMEEVVVEVMTDMNVIDIAGKTETLGSEAGAVVLVLTILKAEEEVVMMMIGRGEVDQ